MKRAGYIAFVVLWLCATLGCRRDMFRQPKSNPLSESDFFPDAAASRPIPAHTVSRDDLQHDAWFYTGTIGTNPVTGFPLPVTRPVLERGKERYEIFCGPCHGLTGDGNGMVVQRGLAASPSLTIDRLRAAPVGHFVEVVVRGYGSMFPQAAQVSADDRWAIAAYIRSLQFSQHAMLAELPPEEAVKFKSPP